MPLSTDSTALQVLTLDRIGRTHVEQARAACRGGATWIQLRAKRMKLPDWIVLATEVVEVCRSYGAMCIVNDSVWVALASGADGVHLGKNDISPVDARHLMGPSKIIGVTVNNLEDAERVHAQNIADYAGVGPWRFTKSKSNLAPVLPPAGIRRIVERLAHLPCYIIGGVAPEDIPPILELGARGVAISSAIVAAEHPDEVVRFALAQCAGNDAGRGYGAGTAT